MRHKCFIERTLRQIIPRKTIPGIHITPCDDWKLGNEVIIEHDYSYARAWACEYDKPTFDGDYNKLVIPNSPEITVGSAQAADEIIRALREPYERSPQKFGLRQTDRVTERKRITTCSMMRIRV